MRNLMPATLAALLAAGAAIAQEKAPEPAPAKPQAPASRYEFQRTAWGYVKGMLLRSAEKMPEESYGFKPADTVRTFGQILGHAADSQFYFCSSALGEKNPNPSPKIETTKTTKAALVAALEESTAYCDRAYAAMNDAWETETVKLFNQDMPKANALLANSMHGVEHYGNLIVYLRIKGLVPPSSEPGVMPAKK